MSTVNMSTVTIIHRYNNEYNSVVRKVNIKQLAYVWKKKQIIVRIETRRVCKQMFASEIKMELLLYQKITDVTVYLRETTDHSRRRVFLQAKSCLKVLCLFVKQEVAWVISFTLWRIYELFERRLQENIFQHIYEA